MKCVPLWIIRVEVLVLAIATLAGCASAPVRIEYRTNGHLTTSTGAHLYQVRATQVGALYLKPGVEFADYGTVAFRPVTLAYEDPPRNPTIFDRTPGNFLMRLGASDRLKRDLGEALTSELGRDEGFRVVAEPDSDTLMVSSHIVRFRWEVPPEQGGESLYVRRTGSMTLILDLRDARTGALLARLADARVIKPAGAGLAGAYESRAVNHWAGVRDVCTSWGLMLRGILETLRGLPPMPAP